MPAKPLGQSDITTHRVKLNVVATMVQEDFGYLAIAALGLALGLLIWTKAVIQPVLSKLA